MNDERNLKTVGAPQDRFQCSADCEPGLDSEDTGRMHRYERNAKLEKGWMARSPDLKKWATCSICDERVYWSEMDSHDALVHPDFHDEEMRWVHRMKLWFVAVAIIGTITPVLVFVMYPDFFRAYDFWVLLVDGFCSAVLALLPLGHAEALEMKYRKMWTASRSSGESQLRNGRN